MHILPNSTFEILIHLFKNHDSENHFFTSLKMILKKKTICLINQISKACTFYIITPKHVHSTLSHLLIGCALNFWQE